MGLANFIAVGSDFDDDSLPVTVSVPMPTTLEDDDFIVVMAVGLVGGAGGVETLSLDINGEDYTPTVVVDDDAATLTAGYIHKVWGLVASNASAANDPVEVTVDAVTGDDAELGVIVAVYRNTTPFAIGFTANAADPYDTDTSPELISATDNGDEVWIRGWGTAAWTSPIVAPTDHTLRHELDLPDGLHGLADAGYNASAAAQWSIGGMGGIYIGAWSMVVFRAAPSDPITAGDLPFFIHFKDWAKDAVGGEWDARAWRELEENYLTLERWVRDQMPSKCRLQIPHKRLPDAFQMEENYLVIEQWVRHVMETGCWCQFFGQSTPNYSTARCLLHVPWKKWAQSEEPSPAQERQNWVWIENWGRYAINNCLCSTPEQ